jgi:hypothetical protein
MIIGERPAVRLYIVLIGLLPELLLGRVTPLGRQTPLPSTARGARRNARLVPYSQGSQCLAKHDEGFSLVDVLAPEPAAGDDDPRRKMRETDAALRDVLMLPAFATGTKHVDATITEQLGVGRSDRNPGIGWVFRHQTSSVGTGLATKLNILVNDARPLRRGCISMMTLRGPTR